MDLSKNNSFLTEEAINYIAPTAFLSSFITETEERQAYDSYFTYV